MSPRIARFNQQYPDISVVFHHSVNSLNFKLRDVDLAIRWEAHGVVNKTKQYQHLAMPLFPACSPKLLERMKLRPKNLMLETDALSNPPLSNIPLLCEDRALDHWQTWFNPINQELNNPRHVISDANVRVQAAIDGQGLIMADQLMQNELDNGLLILPFKQQLMGYGYTLMLSPMQKQ